MRILNKRNIRNTLVTCALASSLFGFSTTSYGFTNLDAGADGQNNGNPAYPATTGYNFVDSNIIFTINGGTVVGTTGSVSIDNNNGFPGQPFSPTNIIMFNAATIQGDIGASNPINTLTLVRLMPGAGTYTLQGSTVNVGSIALVGAPGVISLVLDAANMQFNGNIYSVVGVTESISINKSATINGNIGGITTGGVLTDAVKPATITLNDDLTMNGILNAGNVIFAADKTLTVGADQFIKSPIITGAGNNTGTVLYQGNSTISNIIGGGMTGNRIKQVTLQGMNESTVSINDGILIRAQQVSVNNLNRLTILGDATIDGSLDVAGGALIKLNPFSILTVTNDTVNNKLTLNPGSKVELDMAGFDLNAIGRIDNASDQGPSISQFTLVEVVNPGYYPTPQSVPFLIDSGINGGATFVALFGNDPIQESLLSKFTTSLNGNAYYLNMVSTPAAVYANQSNTFGIAQAFDEVALAGTTGTLQNLLRQLGGFTDTISLNAAMATLAPIVDGAIQKQSFMNQQEVFGYAHERMDRINFWRHHLGQSELGQSAGDNIRDWAHLGRETERGTWAKLFRDHANQQDHRNIPGYRSNTWGVVVGTDNTYNDNLLIGGALSYSFIDMHHHVSENATTTDKSVQAMLYGSLDCFSPYFFTAQMGGGYNYYEITRTVSFGDVSLHPKANTSGWNYGLNTEAGYVFDVRNVHIVPSLSMYYGRLKIDGYDEEGMGTASLTTTDTEYDALIFGVGAKFAQDYVYRRKLIQPEIHAYYYYDAVNDVAQTTASFTGVGSPFLTLGTRAEPSRYMVGTSLSVYTLNRSTFIFNYDYSYSGKDYVSHTGFFHWRYNLTL